MQNRKMETVYPQITQIIKRKDLTEMNPNGSSMAGD
jgi:hypothetical protein